VKREIAVEHCVNISYSARVLRQQVVDIDDEPFELGRTIVVKSPSAATTDVPPMTAATPSRMSLNARIFDITPPHGQYVSATTKRCAGNLSTTKRKQF
jgi:hypothetical protein